MFRCEYWPGSRNLRIQKEFRLLLVKLRAIAGVGFLKNSRLVIAHPATDCLFTKQYALSFVNSEPRRMDRFALYTRFHERRREAWEGCFLFREAPKPNVFVFMLFMQQCYINGYFEFDVVGLFINDLNPNGAQARPRLGSEI